MRTILFTILALVALSAPVFAADAPKGEGDAKKQEMMKAWMKYSTPGEPHKVLAGMAGNWKYTSKWWESAKSKPEESKGTSTMKMILGGRFLQHDTKGMAMGVAFQGIGITGYDNLKEKYDTIWLDNMGTGIMRGTGSFDAATKTLKDKGEHSCPMSDDNTREYRSEWKITDKNNMTYSMYSDDEDGDEFKMMEMVFKRK